MALEVFPQFLGGEDNQDEASRRLLRTFCDVKNEVTSYEKADGYVRRYKIPEAWATVIALYGDATTASSAGTVAELEFGDGSRELEASLVEDAYDGLRVVVSSWKRARLSGNRKPEASATLHLNPGSYPNDSIRTPKNGLLKPYLYSADYRETLRREWSPDQLWHIPGQPAMTTLQVRAYSEQQETKVAGRYLSVTQLLSGALLTARPALRERLEKTKWEQQCYEATTQMPEITPILELPFSEPVHPEHD